MKPITCDLHVHTNISRCGDAAATVESCLEAAKKQNLKTIGFADHCWAAQLPGESPWYKGQDIEHVLKIKKQLPGNISGIRVLVGCETEFIGNGICGLNKELASSFNFVLLPANHFHQRGFVVPEDLGASGAKAVSELLYKRFMETTELGFGTGIVHPFIPLSFLEWEADILGSISETQYESCFKAAALAELAIEINTYTAENKTCMVENGFSSLYLKMHTIARESGCKFFFGSDAHHPDKICGYEKMVKFAGACGIDETMLLVL